MKHEPSEHATVFSSSEFGRKLFDESRDVLFIVDAEDLSIRDLNAAAKTWLSLNGNSDLDGLDLRSCLQLSGEQEWADLEKAAGSGDSLALAGPCFIRSNEGREFPISLEYSPVDQKQQKQGLLRGKPTNLPSRIGDNDVTSDDEAPSGNYRSWLRDAAKLLGSERVVLLEFDPESKTKARIQATSESNGRVIGPKTIVSGAWIDAIRSVPYSVWGKADVKRNSPDGWLESHDVKSLLAKTQIADSGELLGAIVAVSASDPLCGPEPSQAILDLFEVHARYELRQRRSEEAIKDRITELEVINAVTQICSEAQSEDELLSLSTKLIADTWYHDNCGFWLLDENRTALTPHDSLIVTDGTVETNPVLIDRGIMSTVVKTAEALRVGDVESFPDYIPADRRTNSELCIPMFDDGQVVGVLNIEDEHLDAFDQREQELMTTVVRIISAAKRRLISNHQRLERDRLLKESEDRYRSIFENAPDAVFLIEAEGEHRGRIASANQMAEKMHGYENGEMVGLNIAQLDTPGDAQLVKDRLRRLAEGERLRFEVGHYRKDGSIFPVEVTAQCVKIDGRQYVLAFDRDISDQKKLEDDATRFRAMLDHAGDAIFVVDIETSKILDFNQASCSSLGYTREELLEKRVLDIESGSFDGHVERWEAFTEKLRRQSGTMIKRTNHCHKDGSVFPVEVAVSMKGIDGTPYIVAIARDMTERLDTEERLRESQERLRLALDATQLGPWDWQVKEGKAYYSTEWKRQLGYEDHEIDPDPVEWDRRLHPDDRARVLNDVTDYLERRSQEYKTEFRLRHRDGTYRWFYTQGVAQWDEEGNPIRMLGCHVDITDRKKALAELEASERKLAAIAAAIPQSLYVFNIVENETVFSNREIWTELGYSSDQVAQYGEAFVDVILHPGDYQAFDNMIARWENLRDKDVVETEYRLQNAKGEYRWYQSRDTVYARSEEGAVTEVIGTAQDVTERKRIGQLLNMRHETLALLAKGKPTEDVLFSLAKGIEELVGSVRVSILLLEAGRLRGGAAPSLPQEFSEAINGVPVDGTIGPCAHAAAGREAVSIADTFVEPRWADFCKLAAEFGLRAVASRPIVSESDDVLGTIAFYFDEPHRLSRWEESLIDSSAVLASVVLEHARAAQSLKESEEIHRIVTQAARDAILTIDGDAKVVFANLATHRLFGVDPGQLFGQQFSSLVPGVKLNELWQPSRISLEVNKTDPTKPMEVQGMRADGSTADLEITLSQYQRAGTNYYSGILRDVTERNRVLAQLSSRESELAHVGRLSLLGEAVAEIAHEVNQPLYAISNYAKAAAVSLDSGKMSKDQLKERFDRIDTLATNAGEIIQRIRRFVIRKDPKFETVPLIDLVSNSTRLLNYEMKRKSVGVVIDPSVEECDVYVDAIQIEQVLVNLLKNAMDAMDETPPDRRLVHIAVRRVGGQTEVSVRDRGKGIGASSADELFDPFQTTKTDGMGMGLAIARTIIQTHQGKIWLEPNQSNGSANDHATELDDLWPGVTVYFQLGLNSVEIVNTGS